MYDIVAIIGFGLLAAGCWLAWQPLGLIVAGGLLLTGAILGRLKTAEHGAENGHTR